MIGTIVEDVDPLYIAFLLVGGTYKRRRILSMKTKTRKKIPLLAIIFY